MRFLVGRDAFADALAAAVKILPARSPVPIFETVLLSVEGDRLTITSTNMEISLRQRLGVAEAQEGALAVPGKLLHNTVQSLKGPSLHFELKGTNLHLKHDTGKYRFAGFDASGFPKIRNVPDTQSTVIALRELKQGTSAVSFCAAKEDPRAFLTGVLWEIRPEEMRFVASDSQRLGFWRIAASFENELNAIVSRTGVDVMRNLPGEEIKVMVDQDQEFLFVVYDQGELITRLIPGPYAPYEAVIPESEGSVLKVETQEMLSAVRRLVDFTEAPTHIMRMKLTASGCQLEAHSAGGSAEESVSGEYSGQEMLMGVSGRMLLDVLKAVPSQTTLLRFYGTGSPIRIEPETMDPGFELLYLIMPIKLEDEFAENEETPQPDSQEDDLEDVDF